LIIRHAAAAWLPPLMPAAAMPIRFRHCLPPRCYLPRRYVYDVAATRLETPGRAMFCFAAFAAADALPPPMVLRRRHAAVLRRQHSPPFYAV